MDENELKAIKAKLDMLPDLPWRGEYREESDTHAIVSDSGLAYLGEFNDPDERDDAVAVINAVPSLIANLEAYRADYVAMREAINAAREWRESTERELTSLRAIEAAAKELHRKAGHVLAQRDDTTACGNAAFVDVARMDAMGDAWTALASTLTGPASAEGGAE